MINAIKNRIFVKKDEYPDKIGLIYVPKLEGQHAPPYSGTVISVGPDVTDDDIKVGCKLLFHDIACTEFTFNEEKIFSIRDIDVIGIVMDENLNIL
jgi:co-chaperonin GroES (HSP10)